MKYANCPIGVAALSDSQRTCTRPATSRKSAQIQSLPDSPTVCTGAAEIFRISLLSTFEKTFEGRKRIVRRTANRF